MAGESPLDWGDEYISWPSNHLYPDDDTFPDFSGGVAESTTTVHGYAGSAWERVTDTSSVQAMLDATENLTKAIKSIPTTLDMVVGVEDGTVVNATVVAQLFSRYVTSQEGEFVQLQAGQIAANAIGASHIQVGALDGTVITGATVRTNSGNPRIEMNRDSLAAYNSRGTQTFRLRGNDGSVYIRGNLGLTNSWSGVNFQDIVAGQEIYKYSSRAMWGYTTYQAPGLVWTRLTNALRWPAVVSMVRTSRSQAAGSSLSVYGLMLQVPTQNRTRPPVLMLTENEIRYAMNDSKNVEWSQNPSSVRFYSDNYIMRIDNSSSARQFFAASYNAGNESGYYNRLSMDTSTGLYAYHDNMYFHVTGADSGGLYWRNYYNTITSGGNATGSFTATADYLTYYTRSGSSAYLRLNIRDGGYGTQFFANSTGIGLQITNGGQFWINQSGQAQWYNTVKSFQMDVPGYTAKTGLTLTHIVTESPWNGIEYWETVTADEHGEAEWVLPDYVDSILSEVTPLAVFATCSTGTAAAVVERVFGSVVVRVSEAVPGAVVNLLVKAGRIIPDMDFKDENNHVTRWTDEVPQVWTLPPNTTEYAEDGRSSYTYGDRHGGLGPATEQDARDVDASMLGSMSETFDLEVPAKARAEDFLGEGAEGDDSSQGWPEPQHEI